MLISYPIKIPLGSSGAFHDIKLQNGLKLVGCVGTKQ